MSRPTTLRAAAPGLYRFGRHLRPSLSRQRWLIGGSMAALLGEVAVEEALGKLAQGRTTLLTTHDLRHAEGADRILFLEKGRVGEEGTHRDLMAVEGRYAALAKLGRAGRSNPARAKRAVGR